MSAVEPTIEINAVPRRGRPGALSVALRWAAKWRFARNVMTLSLGTALAQSVGIILSPVLTRLYTPSDLGVLGLFLSFVSVATVATSMSYELGIVSAPTNEQATHLTWASMLLSVPVSLLLSAFLYMVMHFKWLGFGALPGYSVALMAATLLLIATFSNLRYWAIRQERFRIVARTSVFQQTTRSISQVALGFLGAGPMGLLFGEMIGRGAGIGSLFRNAWPALKNAAASARTRDLKAALVQNRNLAMYSMPSSVIDSLAGSILVPLIIQLYGPAMGGEFALTRRVLAVPLALIATSVADTFHSRMAVYAREKPEQMLGLFARTSVGLFLLGLGPALILFFGGERIFAVAFGQRWSIAGTLAGISAPFFLAQMVVSPLSRLVFVLRGQKSKFVYDLILIAGILLVFSAARRERFSLVETVWAITLVNIVCYAVYYLVLLRIVAKSAPKLSAEASGV
jgi:O-antigen/teichoic acid export membrane protein